MAKGKLEDSVKFAAKLIKKNPDITMAEMKKAAKPHGISIYPLAIGKAKVSLGMGTWTKEKGEKKKKQRARRAAKRGSKRAPARRNASTTGRRPSATSFRQEAAEKLREVAARAIMHGDDKTAGKLLEMIKQLG